MGKRITLHEKITLKGVINAKFPLQITRCVKSRDTKDFVDIINDLATKPVIYFIWSKAKIREMAVRLDLLIYLPQTMYSKTYHKRRL